MRMRQHDADAEHPTHALLIQTTIELLQEQRAEEIKIDDVLEKSRVSIGSLYYHFNDFDALIGESKSVLVERGIYLRTQNFLSQLEGCQDRESAKATFNEIISVYFLSVTQETRLATLSMLYQAEMDGDDGEAKRRFISNRSQLWVDIYTLCVDRGWTENPKDPQVVAVMLQIITLGKFVREATDLTSATPEYESLMFELMEQLIFG